MTKSCHHVRRATLAALLILLAGPWLPAAEVTKAQWRDDLRYFARELPKRHKNLYHATSREQFERAIAELDAAIPSLQDHKHLISPLKQRADINQKGRLFVVIGRQTFAAAMPTPSTSERTRTRSSWASQSANGRTAIQRTTR